MPAIGTERAVLDCVETMSGNATMLLLAAFFSLLEMGERAGSDGFDVGRRVAAPPSSWSLWARAFKSECTCRFEAEAAPFAATIIHE